MKRYGLKFKPQIRYACDDEFFSQENEETFYMAGFMAGFMAADGCVKDRKGKYGNTRPEVSIGLAKSDKDHLEKLRNLMKAEVPIRDFIVKNSQHNSKWNDTWKSELTITSQQMVEDLKRFNIVPRKSLIYTFPEWLKTHHLVRHYIRGYNDGDGSFYKLLGKNKITPQLYFSLRGTPEFLTEVRYILEKECDLEERDKPIRISSGHGCLEYGGNGIVKKIADYLYQDATIYLERKFNIGFR